ncbi:hypothetical protein ACFX1S_014758 [Malus domestica]
MSSVTINYKDNEEEDNVAERILLYSFIGLVTVRGREESFLYYIIVAKSNHPNLIHLGGSNTPLSATDILARLLSNDSGDAENLQRILRMLTNYGVFTEHLNDTIDGSDDRKFSLTAIGKTLVTDKNGSSYNLYVLQHHQDVLMSAWPMVHEAVVDATMEPFVKVNGELAYEYYGKKPEMNGLMQKAMSSVSVSFMNVILDGYDGFEGVERLMDVGGSAGDCLQMILWKHTLI